MLKLLHLCDSLFPIGGFAYSDGLEAAAGCRSHEDTVDTVREWLDVCLDESLGRADGPAVWHAWTACRDGDWPALATLDDAVIALRPASAARRSTRAMGRRLLTTWDALYPDPRVRQVLAFCRDGERGPSLPVAFAAACACGGVDRRAAIEAFAYTRLASTVSAAMRLMALGQTDAHVLLARTLERVPATVDAIETRGAPIECLAPAMDIAAMSQQYLHSRLFRS